jgi:hypothetical protein
VNGGDASDEFFDLTGLTRLREPQSSGRHITGVTSISGVLAPSAWS